MAISSLETTLTKHVRALLEQYPTPVLKKFAFVISLVSCLCAGSVLLFPLFTPILQSKFHYTQFEINIIGSFTSLMMYAPLSYLGYLGDCHGPVILSIISVCLFAPGYTLAALTISNNWSFWVLACSFALIGCATSAFYFSCLLSCAKIYPRSKGLTISAPVTCYGLSSFIGSQLLKLSFLRKDGHLDLYMTFRFFSVLYLLLGVFNWISSSIVTIERDLLLRKHDNDEESPLLQAQNDAESGDNEDTGDDLVAHHKEKFKKFVSDISAWLLLACLLLSVGPSEMYITNMGSLINTISPESSIPDQVSIHAVFSTIARLTLGGLSDCLVSRYSVSRVWLLFFIVIMGMITQVFVATMSFVGPFYYIISALSGLTYGALFTLFPTVVLALWGSELFGSAYGFLMMAPALGASGYGILYGVIYDVNCEVSTMIGGSCISPVFWLTSLSFGLCSALIILAWRWIWVKRGIPEF